MRPSAHVENEHYDLKNKYQDSFFLRNEAVVAACTIEPTGGFGRALVRVCLAGLLLLGSGPVRAQADADLQKEFLNSAPQKWKDYTAFLGRLQGTFSSKTQYQGKTTRASKGVIKQNGDYKLFVRQFSVLEERREMNAGSGFVWCFNGSYAFSLKQHNTEAPWALAELDMTQNAKGSNSTKTANGCSRLLGILIRIGPTDLVELVRQPSFRVIDAKRIEFHDREAVLIEFTNIHSRNTSPFIPVQGGTLILDPDRHWCLLSCKVIEEYSGVKRKTNIETSYRGTKSNHPIPIRVVEETDGFDTDRNAQVQSYSEDSFELDEPAQLPAYAEFTMTAFGLPEPMGMPPVDAPKSRQYLWITFASIMILVCAIGLWKLRQRKTDSNEVKASS